MVRRCQSTAARLVAELFVRIFYALLNVRIIGFLNPVFTHLVLVTLKNAEV